MTGDIRAHRKMLRHAYLERGPDIRRRLDDFRRVAPGQYVYELIYCLLTPQSSARNADAVVRLLAQRDFAREPFDPEPLLRDRAHYIRFHRTKARRVVKAAGLFPEIGNVLTDGRSAPDLRDWLVDRVDGFGLKEATHFLRNIGKNEGLAILDRHVLRHLVWSGALDELPASMTRNRYLTIEKTFSRFARTMRIPIDEMDLLFWSLQTGEILK